MKNISGWFTYDGTTTMQHENISETLTQLFLETSPSQILEIGTSYGGLTLLIRDILDKVNLPITTLRSYDVIETNRYWLEDRIKNGGNIELIIKNVFTHSYFELNNENRDEIVEYIQRPGRTIVMCDGGSKKNEFVILSEHLKSGDIIMAHDYSPNEEYFNQYIHNKIWNWMEIQDSDIENSVVKHNLEPFMSDEFKKVVWVCKRKK